ncbi:MAG: FliA/WhiG family RNA polymerase sigma factor [Candidatus Krumholzibacteriia bacterium]
MTQDNPLAHLELWQAYLERGDQDARQRLVEQYLRVVRYVAGRMAVGLPHYVEYNDLVSAGLLGLIQAIDNFDHQRGIKFETYAIPRIRGAILDELRSQDWFPRSLRRKAKQVEVAYATLEVRLGRPATDEEIARELGIEVGELDGLLSEVSLATIMSLDADPNGDDEQQSGMGDYLPDPRSDDVERGIAEQEMRELISHRLAELPEKEQLVLVLYYYEELTLKEIGEILDVTESRVCQIHTKAILRLKGKIDRHEGKTSIGRLTSEIQQRRPAALEPLAVKVNIMAGLLLASLAARLIAGPPV